MTFSDRFKGRLPYEEIQNLDETHLGNIYLIDESYYRVIISPVLLQNSKKVLYEEIGLEELEDVEVFLLRGNNKLGDEDDRQKRKTS